jgi:epoxyqueuosine reductase
VDLHDRRRRILAAGTSLGFSRPRVARVAALDRREFYERWVAEGRAGDMRFLLHHRKARVDPHSRYPWARSIVSAFLPYEPPPPPRDWRREMRGRIAAYAYGADYHDVVANRLEAWRAEIERIAPGSRSAAFVDTGAVFEHEWAARAGVGWTGRHTLTLNEELGSWGFLAEVLIDLELEPDLEAVDRCGSCDRCVAACPTAAIEDGYRLDPRRCISYLTIEHKGAIDPPLRPLLGAWIFGCDLCQEPCPWNGARRGADRDELSPRLGDVLAMDDAAFDRTWGASALRRAGRVRLARNAAVALGNGGQPGALPLLALALGSHDAPLVRGHAAWAIGRLPEGGGPEGRRILEAGLRDPDPSVRAEVVAALGGSRA